MESADAHVLVNQMTDSLMFFAQHFLSLPLSFASRTSTLYLSLRLTHVSVQLPLSL